MRKGIYYTKSIVLLTTLVMVATDIAQQVVETTSPSAQEIINKVAHAYSSCQSYKDKGVVTTVFFLDDGGKRTTMRPFTTAFIRPDRFRFEFQSQRRDSDWDRYIVYRDGESVCTWWSVRPGIEKQESLSMAIAGATGVSGSSAHTAPRLLLPDEVTGSSLAKLTDLELLGEEHVAGVPCFKIQGIHSRDRITTLWIDKKSYLVMKIFASAEFSGFRTETTTTYGPQFNVDIQSEDLEFNPPSEAKYRETEPEATPSRKLSISVKNRKIPLEMRGCAGNLKKIYQATKKYEKDKGRLPDWLSDLVPDYLSNEGLFCPNDAEHKADFSPDPRLPCSYSWQFSTQPIPTGWDPTGKILYRDWKKEQTKLFGDVVPLVRCSHHDSRRLNLSVGGQVWWGERDWEYMFISNYDNIHKQMLSRLTAPRSAEAEQRPSLIGTTAPSFTLKDLSSKPVSLSDFKGKVVLLDFWATWCGPCRNAIPHLEALHKKYKDQGLVVIGINHERDHDKVKKFAEEQISYVVVLDGDEQFKAYGIRGIPTAFYIDRKGKVRYCKLGFRPGSEIELERKVKELLAESEEVGAAPASEPSKLAKDLIGAWVLAGTPDNVGEPPSAGGRLKFFTGGHWAITQADPNTGVVIYHHGGTYTLNGDELVETVTYANQNTAYLIKRNHKFKVKVEGDTYTQIGIDNPWNEVWKRAKLAVPTARVLGVRSENQASTGGADAELVFSNPANLGPTVNSVDAEYDPSISADELELYFNSYRPGGLGQADLWVTTRKTKRDPWGTPENLGPIVNSPAGDKAPCISADGLSLYFSSGRPGGYGDQDLWVTTRKTKNAPWGEPVNLGPTVNSEAGEHSPSISTDGLTLYFAEQSEKLDRPGGFGNGDIWVTTRKTKRDPWGTPVNLGPIVNSPAWDQAPSISDDGLTLYFDSERGGDDESAIWVTKRKKTSDPWGTPVRLGPRINSSGWEANPDISRDGFTLYFVSVSPGGSGATDLWQVSLRKQAVRE